MKALRIATYNCMNFFDRFEGSNAKSLRGNELDRLARVIYQSNADVIALQEIQGNDALGELQERLAQFGDTSYAHGEVVRGNYWRKLSVGILSRRSFTWKSHAGRDLENAAGSTIWEFRSPDDARAGWLHSLRFRRDLMLAEITIGTRTLAIFNHHLKSRLNYPWLNTSDEVIRTAESQGSAEIIRAYMSANPKALVVVAGDLNHRRTNASVKALTTGLGFLDPIHTELVPSKPQLSTYWKTSGDRIDYLLVSDTNRYILGSAHVYQSAAARVASDHYCVSVDVDL